jgi:energy-coupling factor transporter ATP-binding protein EcfA2
MSSSPEPGPRPGPPVDARPALIAALAFVVATAVLPLGQWRPLGALALALIGAAGYLGVPPRAWLGRWVRLALLVAFLGLLVGLGHPARARLGLGGVAAAIAAKNAVMVGAVALVATAYGTTALLGGLRSLGLPGPLATGALGARRADRLARPRPAAGGPVRAGPGARRADRGGPARPRLGRPRPPAAPGAGPPPMNAPPPAVLVRGLTYRYPDGREALRGVDLEIEAGESVALIGPNGAGKSTFLWHLNGLLPGRRGGGGHHAEAGAPAPDRAPRVWIDGLAVEPANFRAVRRRVGLLFQDPDDQLFSPTVLDDVAFGPRNQGLPPAEAERVARECLARVELSDAADRPPHHLSFGERKRACLAGVLACGPAVLALDEPTANLDPRARRRFLALIGGLDATRLIATHDLEMVLDLCPRAVVLDAGRVAADGPAAELLGDAALMEAHGLEVPYRLR